MKANQNRWKTFYRALAALCALFFVVFKILKPYATGVDLDITLIDQKVLAVSFAVVFLIEALILAFKKKLTKQ